jgi:NADPH-dependent glutamate synthase beta subunit-like oxidoreductase/NAD-dependent dihydropyrimidine dehydrogenase PreA subunit
MIKKKTFSLVPALGAVLPPGNSLLNKTGSWRSQRPVFGEKISPCIAYCPAGNDIQHIINLVSQQDFTGALKVLKKTNPFPAITGRVCYHPCESKCNRTQYDENIAIQAIERFLGDFDLSQPAEPAPVKIYSEKVAIAGSGPAGLTCAYYLSKAGYSVTVFETQPVAGGMLSNSIPNYRLPAKYAAAAIETVGNLGVDIVVNSPITSIDSLLSQGFKSVFIASGAQTSIPTVIEGIEKKGVIAALPFLKNAKYGTSTKAEEKVLVIGGGNVAIDAARVALRQGAAEVTIVYRRTRAEMPANNEEIVSAEEEGIRFIFLANPTRVIGNASVSHLECIKMKLGPPDRTGRPQPEPVVQSEFKIEADTIIFAIGQKPDGTFTGKIKTSSNGTIIIDNTGATSVPGVFAGGDVVTGPAMVSDAIGSGRKAACSINCYLRGLKPEVKPFIPIAEYKDLNLTYTERAPALKIKKLPPSKRKHGFPEITITSGETDITLESERCLSCGVCGVCGNCWIFCPDVCITEDNGKYIINYDYCKGCGVCANECPCGAITLVTEQK